MRETFAAFILTNGRPDRVITYKALRKQGYTGRIVLIVDDEDSKLDQYQERFGAEVFVFSKSKAARKVMAADNFGSRQSEVYARNESFEIARTLGIEHFIQLDDDYNGFHWRRDIAGGQYVQKLITNLDAVWEAMLDYYLSIPAVTFAMTQSGDFIGGRQCLYARTSPVLRKAMNSFICSTDRPFRFPGTINGDVNAYTLNGSRGDLFLSTTLVSLNQALTQSTSGGMTEVYRDSGTYTKAFYTVMQCPSSVRIDVMGTISPRIHHKVFWNNAVPKILSDRYQKGTTRC